MTRRTVIPKNRSVLRCIVVPSALFVAFVSCGGKSATSDKTTSGGSSEVGGAAGSAAAGGMAGIGPGSAGAADATGGAGRAGIAGFGGIAAESGGAAGSDGAAGSADSSAGAGGSSTTSCVNVSGGGKEPRYKLTVVGTQFNTDEGEHMRIAVASQTPNRVGIADLPIVGGAFTLSMPQVLNAGQYIGVTLYVDRNHDNTCQTDEHAWDWTTSAVAGDMRFDVTPDQLCDKTLGSCRARQPTQQPCWVGTGQTKLTDPLPCTP